MTEGYTDDSVDRYLSLSKETDDALEYLIEYFKDYDEPTIIVMFGDHYPICRTNLRNPCPERPTTT